MIAGITHENDRAAGRVRGFLRELARHGIERGAVQVIESAYRVGAGAAAMKRLLETETPPTAIFCGSDILAAGAVKHCVDQRIDIPRSVSILGFDNHEIAELTTPELTTLEVPAREMGRLAGDYVLASPAQRPHLHQRELSIRLVVRGSTGPAASSD
jgi:LacI family transcriptional regulator